MKKKPDEQGVNMTPMIDVVFQLIIFFVCTAAMEKAAVDESIRLAMSPHGKALEMKDPREINVDVNKAGRLSIGRVYMNENTLRNILRKAVNQQGSGVPVVIRGDGLTKHEDVKKVMDACSYAGLWKVKFSAVKDRAK